MRLTIDTNFPKLSGQLDDVVRQVRYASAVALTRTGQEINTAIKDEMRQVFEGPTRFTLNAPKLRRARVDKLEAEVYIGDSVTKDHYLAPQVFGGRRLPKRFEDLLRARGILRRNEFAVPGDGARINAATGNMYPQQIIQILSQLDSFATSGFMANRTGSRRSVAKRRKMRYFYARQGETRSGGGAWRHGDKTQHLRTGIYLEDANDREFLKPVLIFVKGVTYQKRLPYFETAQRVFAASFETHFDREFRKAMATARWGRRV